MKGQIMQKEDLNLMLPILGIILVLSSTFLLENNLLSLACTIIGILLIVRTVKA